jgi:hypothetical protein
MTKTFERVSPSNQIIIFLSLNCQACQDLEAQLPDIDGVEFVKYWVTPSRINGKMNIRPDRNSIEGMPIIVDSSELPVIPAAFDPNTQELSFGIKGIFSYLESCGLL